MTKKPHVVFSYFDERELHFVGDYAVVAWNIDKVGQEWIRTSEPYVDLTFIHPDGDPDDIREDKDRVNNGWPMEMARQIHAEIGQAIWYLRYVEA